MRYRNRGNREGLASGLKLGLVSLGSGILLFTSILTLLVDRGAIRLDQLGYWGVAVYGIVLFPACVAGGFRAGSKRWIAIAGTAAISLCLALAIPLLCERGEAHQILRMVFITIFCFGASGMLLEKRGRSRY